jgi:hypothetical protein
VYGWTYNGNRRGISDHAWGGGIDGQYFPLQYLGFAIEGDFFNERIQVSTGIYSNFLKVL